MRSSLLLVCCCCVSLPLLDSPSAFAQSNVARWSFEEGAAPSGESEAVTPSATNGALRHSDEVPGAYIYDPLAKKSRSNRHSARFGADNSDTPALKFALDVKKAQLAGESVTIECFVKPSTSARGDARLVGKTRSSMQASELALAWNELRNQNQTWHGILVAPTGQGVERTPVGHYSSSTRLTSEASPWRHLAVVYDAKAKTVTGWVDYHLSRTIPLKEPLTWDDGPLVIGQAERDTPIEGLIDEVRIVRGALSPAWFLRARSDAIENVSFVSNQKVVPADAGCLDAKEHFGAVGDGKTDDTAALNAAFAHLASRVPLAYSTLIIPPGEYLISGRLHCSRFIDVKGAGPDKTILRLKDNTFTDPTRPQPVLRMSSTQGDPGSNGATNGSSISLYLDGLTIDTGKGNPGAKALEYHSNNIGRLENVVLRSGDGSGVVGLDLTHHDVGPALVKRVRVEGFDTGIAIRYQEYSMTLEHVELRGQKVVGILNQGNILAMRGIRMHGPVPAIDSRGANSMVTLLDSQLTGGDGKSPAIRCEGGLYLLRVKTEGYAHAVTKRALAGRESREWNETTIAGPDIDEYAGEAITVGHGARKTALQLPIEETPEPPLPPVDQWVNALSFADDQPRDDWSPVLQRAIDSGAKVLYLPAGTRFSLRSPIYVRGKVERIIGFGHELRWDPSVWKESPQRNQTDANLAPPPLLIFDEPNAERVVVLDRLGCVHVRHASPATLVLRSSSPDRYSTSVAGGKLFAEDIGGADWHFDHPQRVWVRQWNPESHAAGPCIHSVGATIWCLGFKTEYESQKLLAEKGAATEILGSFIYPLGKIPEDRPIFENRDSQIALVYGTSVYHANHRVHVRDVQGNNTKTIGNDALRWAGSRARMDLYISDAR